VFPQLDRNRFSSRRAWAVPMPINLSGAVIGTVQTTISEKKFKSLGGDCFPGRREPPLRLRFDLPKSRHDVSASASGFGAYHDPTGPVGCSRDIYHEVGPYETLWRISSIYSVDMATIMRVNHLTSKTQLKKGMKLLIPNTRGRGRTSPLFPTTRWTHIVIHHTATDQGSAYSIDGLHHQRGWENGMGYDFLIDNGTRGKTSGQIESGPVG